MPRDPNSKPKPNQPLDLRVARQRLGMSAPRHPEPVEGSNSGGLTSTGGDRRISLQQGRRDSSPLAAQGTLNDGGGDSQPSKPLVQHPRFRLAMGLATVVLILGGLIALLNRPTPIAAAWWDDSYQHRRPVTVSNGSSQLTDHQVSFTLDTAALIAAGKMQNDCDDIRLVDAGGSELPHWIEENNPGCDNAATVIWTRAPVMKGGGSQLILYYGNANASNAEDPERVFEFFDDFSGGSLNTGKWVSEDSPNQTGGVVELNASDDAVDLEGIRSVDSYCDSAPGDGDACVLGWYAVQDNAGSLGRLGFSNTADLLTGYSTDDASAFLFDASTGGNHETENAESGTTESGSVGVAEDTFYHGFELSLTATGSDFEIDGTSASLTTEIVDSASYIRLETTDITNTLSVDWIYVRRYASSQPTSTAGGSGTEEDSPDPVLHWTLDEANGSTVSDSTANANSGTITNAVWDNVTPAQANPASLRFDGSGDFVSRAYSSDSELDPGTGGFGVALWFKHGSAISATEYLISRYNGAGYKLYLQSDGTLCGGIDDDATWAAQDEVCSSLSYADNTWHFAHLVKSGTSSLTLYVDGTQVAQDASLAATGSLSGSSPAFYAGIDSDGASNGYNGWLDDVRVYGFAHDEFGAEMLAAARGATETGGTIFGSRGDTLGDGLVVHLTMDDDVSGDAQTLVSDSAEANDGSTIDGANDAGMDCTTGGRYALGCDFDGVDDRVSLDSRIQTWAGDGFTYTGWVYWEGAGTNGQWHTIFADNNGVNFHNNFYIHDGEGDQLRYEAFNHAANARGYANSGFQMPADQWVFLALAFDRSTQTYRVFMNDQRWEGNPGELYDDGDGAGDGLRNFGARSHSGSAFDGRMDDIRVYDRPLSDFEIRQLYQSAPGPVLYYNFDEGNGTGANAVKDRSGNGLDGTMQASMTNADWTQGKFGKGLDFDGSNDLVNAGSTTAVDDVFEGGGTLSVWVYPRSWGSTLSTSTVVGKTGSPECETGWCVRIQNDFAPLGSVLFTSEASDDVGWWLSEAGSVVLNQWNHIVVRYDQSDLANDPQIWVNGTPQTITEDLAPAGTVASDAAHDLFVGAGNTDYFLDGVVDEVRLYNYLRTPEQIIEDRNAGHPLGGSPVGSQAIWLQFDEGQGDTVNDSGPQGNDGDLAGSCPGAGTCPSWTPDGKYDRALDFDGTDDFVSVAADASFDLFAKTGLGMCVWVAPDSDGEGDAGEIWSKGNSYLRTDSESGGAVEISALLDLSTADASFNTTTTIPTGSWSQVCLTWTDDADDELTIWIDGESAGSSTNGSGTPVDDSANDLLIGGDSSNNFDGRIDELRWYPAAIDLDDIRREFNAGSSAKFGSLSTEADGITPSDATARGYCPPGDTDTCNMPVLELNLDEKNGTSVTDTSGGIENSGILTDANGGNGDGNTPPVWTQGWIGAALDFDGADDFVDMGPGPGTVRSVEFWVRPESATGYLVDLNGAAYVWNNGGTLVAQGFTSPTMYINGRVSTALTTGSWQHVVITTATPINATDLDIGRVESVGWTTGAIDQVRLYDYARTPRQVAWSYNDGAPIGHWKFDECVGTGVYDSSGGGLDGVISAGGSGGNTSVGSCAGSAGEMWADGASGKFSASLEFDGANDLVTIAHDTRLTPGSNSSWSMGVWAKLPAADQLCHLIAKRESVSPFDSYNLFIGGHIDGGVSGSQLVGYYQQDSTLASRRRAISDADVTDGNWHHYFMVADQADDEVRLYLDGSELSKTDGNDGSWPTVDNTEDLVIGNNNSTAYCQSQMDDVRLYNYALTPEQIQIVMNNASGVRFGQ